MILSWLAAEFNDIFVKNPDIQVALWFDAKEEFARLLDGCEFPPKGVGFTLLRYRQDAKAQVFHGPLWLKAQIHWETRHLTPDERATRRYVLYLPFSRDVMDADTPLAAALEPLLEYRFAGKTWLLDGKEPTLFQFLRKRGVPLPTVPSAQRSLWEGGRDSLLAKFAAEYADKDGYIWQQPLDAARVSLLLVGGDLSQRLLDVLADPDHQAAYLQEQQRLDEFGQAMSDEFGYSAPLLPDPHGWARDFALRLALNECFLGYGQPVDFPFSALLPEVHRRDRWLAFWKRWTSDRDLAPVYNSLIRDVEGNYNLLVWAKGHKGSSQAFAHLARAQWEEEYVVFEKSTGSRSHLEDYAQSHTTYIKEAAAGYWAKGAGDLPGWGLLSSVTTLTEQANAALEESKSLVTPADFVAAYADHWHGVDAAYWRIYQDVRRSIGLEAVLKAADLVYRHYLTELNDRFVRCFTDWKDWDAWGTKGVQNANSAVWEAKGKTAVIIADALRYDLAAALKAQITGAQADLEPWITAVPSITPVGMTALLPLKDDTITAVLSTGKLELLHDEFGDLTIKDKRRQLLQQRCGAVFLELPDLLSSPQLPNTKSLVVFTSEIDGQGHKTGVEVAKHLDQLLTDLRVGIGKLHMNGFNTVHVVADHGFVLLADGSEKVDSPGQQAILKSDRYAFLKDGAVVTQTRLPFALDDRQQVAYPPGVACFSGSREYVHGGLSLQEIVIPHLKTWTATKAERIGVECVLPATEIATLAVKVILIAKTPAAATLLDQPQSRTVEITFVRNGQSVAQTKQATLSPEDPEDTKSLTVFLDDSETFHKGEVLALQVRDLETKEDLASGKSVTLLRHLEG